MKKIFALLLGLTAMLSACKKDDFLEPKTNALTEDTVFADSTRTMAFLNRIYGDIGFTFQKQRWSSHGNSEHATDDAEYNFSGAGQVAVQLYSGVLTPLSFYGTGSAAGVNFDTNNGSDFWVGPWQNIRRCNLMLSKLPITPLSGRMRTRVTGELRFLRAYYYYQLLIGFGGMPLIGDKVYGIEDIINIPRNPYADCVTYVTTELDAAATVLPRGNNDYSAPDYGRITGGACLALKSRVLLYAASPLFNGGAETGDASLAAVVSYPTASTTRWQDAANAAKAVIDLGLYSLNVDNTKPGYGYYSLFLRRVNPEYILAYNRPANRDMEFYYSPPSRGGSTYSMPTQNLVDAFPMRNGKAITDPGSGYNPNNPYVNRDPRFNYSIIYNGASFFLNSANRPAPVYTYEGAASDGFNLNNSYTGYWGRKMCDSTSAQNTERGWPLIRYGEILLNYAEALNELGRTEEAVSQLVLLRQRAGILPGSDNRYGISLGMSQTVARDLIRNERHIELCFEDSRYNDIRRWKIAMVTNNAFNNRMRITNRGTVAAPGPYTYAIVPTLRRHNFRPEMYLLPLPDAEIRKVPLLRQNPGW